MQARYLRSHGDRLFVGPSAEDGIARGTLLSFVFAPLILLSASTAAWVMADDELAFLVGWGAGALPAAALALTGFWMMATASQRAARRRVRLDLAERTLVRPGRPVEVLRDVETVDVRAGRWPRTGFTLALIDREARATPLVTAPRGRGAVLARTAAQLADRLDAALQVADAERARGVLPADPRGASALCHLPIDGFAQGISLFYLMTTRDPFVRFNAKQSLLLTALELGAGLALGVFAFLALRLLPGIGAAALACPFIVLAGVRVTVRILAASRAQRGRVWIQPWLAPISRRWAPR